MYTRFIVGSLIALVPVVSSLGETPLSTSLTYQGQLKDGGVPLTDTADFQFTLWDAPGSGNPPAGGAQVGSVQAINALPVTAGLFSATLNASGAFGVNAFNGNARWLQVAVRSPAGAGGFTTLAPRQPLTAAPQALVALSVPGAVGGSGTTNSIPFWSSGTTLGDSVITQNANGVQLPNGVQLAVGAQGNGLSFGSPNGETGLTIGGPTGRADLRFGTFNSAETKLKLVVRGAGSGPPAETNGIAITTAGYVGIGTASPASKLDIAATGDGAELLRLSTERPWVFRQAYFGPGTALRLQPVTGLKNFEITAAGGTNVATFVGDDANPRVGIGTTNPLTKLALNGGTPWTSAFWNGSLSLSNASAIGWEANASGQRFGIGQSTGGLYFFRTYAAFGQTVPPPNYDLAIQDNGNLTQARANNGLVKAMAFVNADGTILRCYNGVTGASGNCGFSVFRPGGPASSYYNINFGFQVDDRFVSVTPQSAASVNIGASFLYLSSTVVQVRTFIPDVDWSASGAPNPFMIIVY